MITHAILTLFGHVFNISCFFWVHLPKLVKVPTNQKKINTNHIFVLICFFCFLFSTNSTKAQSPRIDSLKNLLCNKNWHLVKLAEIGGTGQSMGGEVLNVYTKFNLDGTSESTSAGKVTKESWKLIGDGSLMESDQLKDPKSGQEKITIKELTKTTFVVQITYRGNNIMQYSYVVANEGLNKNN